MLKKAHRLPRQSFAIRDFATAARTPCFSVKIRKSDGGHARIGVIVPKAAAKTAAQRNFLKRQIKATAVRIAAPGMDMIVSAFSPAGKLTKKALKEEIVKVLERATK